MNLQDRFAEIFLSLFDAFMDLITLGPWSRSQGNHIPNIKIKK